MSDPIVRDYRCKHTVEAARWLDTDAAREAFCDWFDAKGAMFGTRGPVIVLPEEGEVSEGEWVLYSDGEFLVMTDEAFQETYVEEPYKP